MSASASLVDGAEGAEACLLWHLTDAPEERAARGGAGVLAGPPGRRAFERAVRHQLLRCRRYGEQAALVRCSLHGLPDVRADPRARDGRPLVAGILDVVRRRLRGTDVVAYVGDHEIARAARARRHGRGQDDGRRHPRGGREPAGGDRARGREDRRDRRRRLAGGRRLARPGVRRRRAGDAGARGRRGHRALRAPARGLGRALGGELARLLAGLEAGLGVGRAQLVGGAGLLVGAHEDAIGLQRAGDALARAARQQRRRGDGCGGWSAAPTRRRRRA